MIIERKKFSNFVFIFKLMPVTNALSRKIGHILIIFTGRMLSFHPAASAFAFSCPWLPGQPQRFYSWLDSFSAAAFLLDPVFQEPDRSVLPACGLEGLWWRALLKKKLPPASPIWTA